MYTWWLILSIFLFYRIWCTLQIECDKKSKYFGVFLYIRRFLCNVYWMLSSIDSYFCFVFCFPEVFEVITTESCIYLLNMYYDSHYLGLYLKMIITDNEEVALVSTTSNRENIPIWNDSRFLWQASSTPKQHPMVCLWKYVM